MVQIIRTVGEMQAAADALRAQTRTICMVPTMGYLHSGHGSLIRRARREADTVVVSLFVNPAQFSPTEDLSTYPRDLERDMGVVSANGGDILFAPSTDEMYPSGYATYVNVHGLSEVLEGASRPAHFRGVATVVTKLLSTVRPHSAVFGQKDAQQALVIRRLATDLNLGVRILVSPTVREVDGLAKSSRNVYLTPEERRASTALFRALQEAEARFRRGERRSRMLQDAMWSIFARTPLATVDYAEIRDAESLCPMEVIDRCAVAAVAVRFGKARLIDNLTLLPPSAEDGSDGV